MSFFRQNWITICLIVCLTLLLSPPPPAHAQTSTPPDVIGLAKQLNNNDPAIRHSAAAVLGRMKKVTARGVPILLSRLNHEDPLVRSAAAHVLGEMREIKAPVVPALAQALHDKEFIVRRSAAEALGSMGSVATPAVPDLTTALTDKNHDVSSRAAVALGQIGLASVDAMPAIVILLKNLDQDVREKTADALNNICSDLNLGVHKMESRALHDALNACGNAKKNLTAMQRDMTPDARVVSNALGAVEGSYATLQAESDWRWWNQIPDLAKKNPLPTAGIALVALSWVVTGLLLWLRPLALLHINDALSSDRSTKAMQLLDKGIGVSTVVLGFGCFHHHTRVLDA